MVKYDDPALDATFAALADPTRRAILTALATREASVTELARPFRMSLPGVHKHLRVLERAGLVAHAKQGRERRCRLVARPIKDVARWIEPYRHYWERQFDALTAYLAQSEQERPAWPPASNSTLPLPSGSAARSLRRPSASSGRGRRRRK